MSSRKLNPQMRNADYGIIITKSRRVKTPLPYSVGELANMLKSVDGGDIVFYNAINGESNVWNLEAGETYFGFFTEILVSATIDGVLETTSSAVMMWGISADNGTADPHY